LFLEKVIKLQYARAAKQSNLKIEVTGYKLQDAGLAPFYGEKTVPET
jgi:hypothetical protein